MTRRQWWRELGVGGCRHCSQGAPGVLTNPGGPVSPTVNELGATWGLRAPGTEPAGEGGGEAWGGEQQPAGWATVLRRSDSSPQHSVSGIMEPKG